MVLTAAGWSKFSEFGTVELYVLEASNWNIGNLGPDITKSVIINEVKIPQNLGEMMCITIFLCLFLFYFLQCWNMRSSVISGFGGIRSPHVSGFDC